ncbi:Protein CBG23607 [Caenorhabditis briggsae]|uniref:Protein CBG23607 n=2 Tax=Caenorhabditis briggsae TaxID=6238 RepID=A8WIX6_CAEBR|nr:Protein CBG23607 [Caenorhabditis briggsae]ULT86738.1 hypothetical protein L3Y34_006444 [Caenorhabditis briggsae]CAP20420.1 Protein CBG23607 [Caenorhabditis briggsae]
MRSIIISSALLIILAQCGYTEESFPTTPSYPFSKTYPSTFTYSEVPISLPASGVSGYYTEDHFETSTVSSWFRKRAKARAAQNRKFHRRALQPVRRFRMKKH